MKKIIAILILLVSIKSFSQDVVGGRVIAKQSLYVNGVWVDSIRVDTLNIANDNRTLMTSGAIYKFVSNRIGGGGGGGTGTVTSVTGTANRITITGTPTVAPVVNIAATYVGQTSITTLGTITTGVWNGTSIANANLANSSLTIGSTNISLGATSTTLAGLTSVTSTTFIGAVTGNASTATALATGRTISISGDLTYTSPSFDGTGNVTAAGTLATVNSNVGSFGSATQSGTFTVNGKGLITAASNVTITPAESSITFTDITTNNTSTTKHGFFPKLTANTMYYVDNSGALTALAFGTTGKVLTTNGATSAPTWETPSGGSSTWNGISDPTGDQALTFQAGESSTWTDQNTTEDLFTVNNATSTTNSLFSYNRTSTALAAGNNIMELVSSGANGTNTITSTLMRLSNTNTGTTSTNVGLDITVSGAASENAAIVVNGTANIGVGTATPSTYLPGGNGIAINGSGNTGVSIRNSGSGTYHLIYNTGTSLAFFSSATGGNEISILNSGAVAIGTQSPTAWLHLRAGAATASQAPFKFTSGTVNTTPEAGAMEFDGTNYFGSLAGTRYTFAKTLTATATLDFGNTAAGAATDLTVTLNGSAVGDAVYIGVDNASVSATDNVSFWGWISSTNTVTIRFNNNNLIAAVNPSSGVFRVVVTKY